MGSPGGHMRPKGISSQLFVWLPQNGLLNTLLLFAVPVTIQSIITWAIFIVKPGACRLRRAPGFLKSLLCGCVCVCVCPPPGLLKTIHVK